LLAGFKERWQERNAGKRLAVNGQMLSNTLKAFTFFPP